jgi:nicotinic acid phosphoribosyltransferase
LIFWIWGWLVTNNKTRDAMSAAYKLTNTENWPTWKLSNDRWKETIPGVLDIEIRDGTRYLVQESEPIKWERLFKTVYDNWKIYYEDNDLEEIAKARQQVLKSREWIWYPTKESDYTSNLHEQVRERLKAQIEKKS